MAHLLIVDDEQSICWGLTRLAHQMGHTAAAAASAEDGLESARDTPPDVIVLDVRLPGMDGLEAMQHFQHTLGPVPIIVITAYGQLPTAVEAVRNGAFDYLAKPFDLKVAECALERALRAGSAPSGDPVAQHDIEPDGQIVGTSPVMQEVFKRIALVAPSDASVLLQGESGTGKDLVARAIHRYGRRSGGPFVAVNLASLSPSLVESELFGHVQGAFTGAEQSHKGLLERADGGTIFLDEVADVPLPLQIKLLRALEHGEAMPVGADQPIQSDFRIISATHQDLQRLVAEGRFRHDLYFRLITFEIGLPPLRDRGEDVALLTRHFLDKLSARDKTTQARMSSEAMAELESRPWYGNVRELRNVVEHAMIVARSGTVGREHLPPPVPPGNTAHLTEEEAVASLVQRWALDQLGQPHPPANLYERLLAVVEPPLLKATLAQFGGQCAPAARCLGLHRTTLRKKLDQYEIGGDSAE